MGLRADGVHVIGVVSSECAPDGSEQVYVVEATSWARWRDETGDHLVLSSPDGEIVDHFFPGQWTEVRESLPDIDVQEEP